MQFSAQSIFLYNDDNSRPTQKYMLVGEACTFFKELRGWPQLTLKKRRDCGLQVFISFICLFWYLGIEGAKLIQWSSLDFGLKMWKPRLLAVPRLESEVAYVKNNSFHAPLYFLLTESNRKDIVFFFWGSFGLSL